MGPRPHDDNGRPLAPARRAGATTTSGGSTGWCARAEPLVERMTLVWHDWFATSHDGVGSQRLMLRQNQLFRRNGARLLRLGCSLEVTKDPAMLLWLSGVDNAQGLAERELRARADGAVHARRRARRLHRARRARAGARADRLAQRLEARPWARTTSATTARRHDAGAKRIFGKRGHFDWRDVVPPLRAPPAAPLVLRRQALGLLHPGAARRGARGARSSGSTCAAATRSRPVVEAILRHPALYTGPRMVKPPVVYLAGLLRGARPRRSTPTAWAWLAERRRPAALLPAERGRLGRRALARHRHLPRPLGDRRLRDRSPCVARRRSGEGTVPARPAGARRRARSRCWGNPTFDRRHARPLLGASPSARWPTRSRLEAASLPAAGRERPAPAARRLPRPPDLPDGPDCHCCDEFSRADAPAPRRRRGRPRPARDRAGHAAARPAPGSTGAASSRAALGLALAVYGGAALAPQALRGGHRRGAAAGAAQNGARLRLPRRRRRLALDARPRPATRTTASCARASRCPTTPGPAFAEDTRLRWHPSLRRSRTLHGEGKVTRDARRSATPTRTSRTSPRATSGRSARPTRACAPAGSAATSTASARPTTRCRGSRSTGSLQPALATREDAGRRRSTAPDRVRLLGARRLGRRRGPDARARSAPLGSCRPHGDPGLEPGDRGRRAVGTAATSSSRRSRRRTTVATAAPSPTRRSTTTSRAGSPASPRCSPPGCRCACVALTAPGELRHARRPAAGARRRPRSSPPTALLAFQRDLEARGLADRVLVARLVGVRPPRRRRTARAAPTTARPASAS